MEMVLGWVGLLVAVVAVIFGIRVELLLRKAQAAIQSSKSAIDNSKGAIDGSIEKLANVERSLSTHALAPFPDYMPEVIKLIDEAKDLVHVLCDPPAYSHFSNPEASMQYRVALERAERRGVELRLIFANAETRKRNLERQFGTDWMAIAQEHSASTTASKSAQRRRVGARATCAKR